jgi:hypothetical protein
MRVQLAKLAQSRNQPLRSKGGVSPHPQGALAGPLDELFGRLGDAFERWNDLLGVRTTCPGQGDTVAFASKQLYAQVSFQYANLATHGGLGYMQLVRGHSKIFRTRHYLEHT